MYIYLSSAEDPCFVKTFPNYGFTRYQLFSLKAPDLVSLILGYPMSSEIVRLRVPIYIGEGREGDAN